MVWQSICMRFVFELQLQLRTNKCVNDTRISQINSKLFKMSTTTTTTTVSEHLVVNTIDSDTDTNSTVDIDDTADEPVPETVLRHESIHKKNLQEHRNVLTRNPRKKKWEGKLRKTNNVESYLTTDKRKAAAIKISKAARQYKMDFNRLAAICDNDLTKPGAVFQLNCAAKSIEASQDSQDMLPEAVDAAKSLLNMESAYRELENEGVPGLCSLELSRRILDEETEGFEEIVVQIEAEVDDLVDACNL